MIVIIGAGPTGLGAAYRLQEMGVSDYLLVEAAGHAGGLASSHVDDEGFTWDIGGHVQFSHYRYYDDVLDRAVTCGWLEHERNASVWMMGRWIPYPFQYNIHHLPAAERDAALRDLVAIADRSPGPKPANFGAWLRETFGPTLSDVFMRPYNEKVWGYPVETLGVGWMGERVAVVDVERVRRNIRENRDDVAWGPNNRFRFPLRGGTGAIWRDVSKLLSGGNVRWNCSIASVDASARLLRTADGDTIAYDDLISTMPLDSLCSLTSGLPDDVQAAARTLTHSAVHILGIGLRGDRPAALQPKSWMYFPEDHSPYYRVTVFSNYSPHHVPAGGSYWSLMAEVCESPHRPVDAASLGQWTIAAMKQDGLIDAASEVVSLWQHRQEHGYPTPFLGREAVLRRILPRLEERRIYSRGRFGAWMYEVSNQDHSFMQGVEAADRLLGLGDEPTLNRPQEVNAGTYAAAATQHAART